MALEEEVASLLVVFGRTGTDLSEACSTSSLDSDSLSETMVVSLSVSRTTASTLSGPDAFFDVLSTDSVETLVSDTLEAFGVTMAGSVGGSSMLVAVLSLSESLSDDISLAFSTVMSIVSEELGAAGVMSRALELSLSGCVRDVSVELVVAGDPAGSPREEAAGGAGLSRSC